MNKYIEFKKDLEQLINKHSMENGSNIPDFLLAEYLTNCLILFDNTNNNKNKWYGIDNKINYKLNK